MNNGERKEFTISLPAEIVKNVDSLAVKSRRSRTKQVEWLIVEQLIKMRMIKREKPEKSAGAA